MEPILEESNSELDVSLSILIPPRKDMALRSGFLSLQERLGRWNKQSRNADCRNSGEKSENRNQRQAKNEQFANLHEFFQSKSSLRKQLEQEERMRAARRPKMPIMKLSKQDWNVKCWEERTRSPREASIRREKNKQLQDLNTNQCAGSRLQRPEIQAKVFSGRVDEVAKKLEKVREGQPLDEQLYRLSTNRLCEQRRDHSWTDQLKRELSHGTHNRNVLKMNIMEQQTGNKKSDPAAKSCLGRPIRRLFDDDTDD